MSEITIPYLFELLMRRLVFIILAAVLVASLAFGYCHYLVTPKYAATAQILISNGAVVINDNEEPNPKDDISKISSADLQASMYLSDVCVDLLQSQKIYEQLSVALDEEFSPSALRGMVSVSLKEVDSIFVNITARSADPKKAVQIANTFSSLTPDFLAIYMPSAKVVPTISADHAGKTSPQTTRMTFLGFMAGAVIAYVIFLIVSLNDRTIKTKENFTAAYNIPVLGCIPNFDAASSGEEGYYGK